MASSIIAMRRLGLALGNGTALGRPLGSAVYCARRFSDHGVKMADYVDDDNFHDDLSKRSPVSRCRDPLRSAASCLYQFYDVYDQLSTKKMGWDVQKDEDALRLKVDMPGLGIEDVKVEVMDNTLMIKAEKARAHADAAATAEGEGDGDGRRRYEGKINLTPFMYQINGIKADMINGVLKLTVPKVQYDNAHVVHVAIR